ncbi:MAG: DUF5119 domain-containing protein [Muribaculum sp.]|nr:DUF5119 domain-containing protein [Muribaculum sp.]
MNKLLIVFIRSTLLLSVLGMFPACSHKELCYDHSHTVSLRVNFDWSNAPDARPESMSVYLFPVDGGKPERYEITDYTGGTIVVPKGRFHIITFNSDTKNIVRRNIGDINTFELTTDETSLLSGLSTMSLTTGNVPRADGSGDCRVVANPELLWSTRVSDIVFSDDASGHDLSLAPEQIVDVVTVNIANIENVEHVRDMSATIYDMAGGFYPASRRLTTERVIIPIALTVNKDDATATGTFRTFGHCPEETGSHQMYIYAIMDDGSKWYYTYDLTDSVHNADDGSESWNFEIDGLDLPEPNPGEGGLTPTVEEWENVEITIDM